MMISDFVIMMTGTRSLLHLTTIVITLKSWSTPQMVNLYKITADQNCGDSNFNGSNHFHVKIFV